MASLVEASARVSIHAPLRREERHQSIDAVSRFFAVSIHAPLRREERPALMFDSSAPWAFQSTPPSGERSDLAIAVCRIWTRRFQSTPPSGERSDCLPSSGRTGNGSFNPRPPPERGATLAAPNTPADHLVSIHAPLRREERQYREDAALRHHRFQSTPPSGERSLSLIHI